MTVTEPASQSNSKNDDAPAVPALLHKESAILHDDDTEEKAHLTLKLPPPTPLITITTITTDSIGSVTSPKRKHRPRSLSLTHSPSSKHRGIIIEQDQPSTPRQVGRQPSRSLDECGSVSARYQGKDTNTATNASTTTANFVDYGYKRERDWSGEWNVKDMEQVMHSLRCLRIR